MSRICAMSSARSVPLFGNRCSVVGWICHCRPKLHEQLMNYMEWIPQPCLCMLVGFNEGFTGAVSQWLTKVQPSQLQGVALLFGLKPRCTTGENKHYFFIIDPKWLSLNYFLGQPISNKCVIHHVWQ